ncbi:glycosyltransferase [Bacteroidota bacterium]
MPKILYVWKGKYPWDVRAEKICNSFVRNGFEVFLLGRWTEGQAEREDYKGIHIIRAGYKKDYKLTQPVSFNPVWWSAIKKTIAEIKPDLIMPRDIMLAEACGRHGRKNNIPVVMDMAEHYPAAMKGWKKYNQSFLSRLFVHKMDIPELVEKRAVNIMNGIITVCEEQNFRLYKEYSFNLSNIQVVHNTPELDWFKDIHVKKQSNELIFGHHGYTTDEKNIKNFLLGFIEAAKEENKIWFQIAGSGESIDDLRNIANSSTVREQIEFSGSYNFEELPNIIKKFDIGVIPYQINNFNNYTIHNKVFDFFSAGKPVFVSATNPFIRLIDESKAGIVVDCEDINKIKSAILKMRDYDLKQFSENGIKAFREKYNWDVDSANMINFVKKFI